MLVAEDVVSYFRGLKSYERIWMMCKLQHSCLPFELRFLGTCLEELGRKDFHELRPVENEANSTAEISLSELRKISDKHVQQKIILYLSLLHSHNYSCSNSLFQILCNSAEVNMFLKYDGLDEEDDGFEQLLMIYTLAVNHPAFSCEQKRVLHTIFSDIQVEENKRLNSKNGVTQPSAEQVENPAFASPIQVVQECPLQISTSPENTFPTQSLPNASHIPTIPPQYHHDMSIPMHEQMSMGLAAPNYVRYPFPPAAYGGTIPMAAVFTTTEQTATTHSFMSRSSSPSISNSPSRSSSPSAKTRPLSAPFVRSPQLTGLLPHQPASLPLPLTPGDPFVDMINKESSPLPVNPPHFASEQLYSRTDEELTALGMTEDNIQSLRCVMDASKRLSSDESSVDKAISLDADVESMKNFEEQVPRTSLITYTTAIPGTVDPNATIYAIGPGCDLCAHQINGFVTPAAAEIPCLEHDMNMLRLEANAPSRNSNGSNSDTTSSDQSSPPNTPMLPQNNFNKRNNRSHGSSNQYNVNNNHANNNNDERSNAGDSSSEERNSAPQTSYQGRGRVINNRGRSKNQNTYTRGRGTNRRRHEHMNGNNEEARKPNFSSANVEGAAFQYTTNPVTATVTNATYIQPAHYLRYNPTSFPANSYLRTPAHHPYTSGEIVYQQYPPPQALFHGAIPYTPIVMQKLSCYNCGSQGHYANDCSESTLEDAAKPSQYRLDYTPVEGFSEK